jgi:hypothetical protein
MERSVEVIKVNTVGDLLDELARLAKLPEYHAVLDASIESPEDVFNAFKIIRKTYKDGSELIDFEFVCMDLDDEA